MKLTSFFLLCFFKLGFLVAQVQNNNVNDRIELQINQQPIQSTTAGATVEWNCIDKKLTEKCLIYHNDQWFYFIPNSSENIFITITNQNCKNQKGVQIVVIKGDPCVRETYQLIHCLSFTDQSDTFIELKNLESGTPYLINIDGFLADQCSFEITISTQAIGLPVNRDVISDIDLNATVTNQSIDLTWYASTTLLDSIQHFEVYKKTDRSPKFNLATRVEKISNTVGVYTQSYSYSDSVKHIGRYHYVIVGVENESGIRHVIDQFTIDVKPPKPEPIIITHNVHFAFPGPVDIELINPQTGSLLDSRVLNNGQETEISLDVAPHITRGIKFFKVIARHRESGNSISKVYFLDETGKINTEF